MDLQTRNPLLKPSAIFLVALSLSIGWGIRGNFGHEAGAMIAGALSAIAVALLSARDDWRRRVAYFALLGGLGWGLGLLGGAALYFFLTGRFRNDASLFLYLSLGWLLAFIAMPVIGSKLFMNHGGLRVMPPRSDDWAGILGLFLAGLLWARRHGLKPVAQVMSAGFILGGISFASMQMIRYFLRYPGHPWRFDGKAPEPFTHYQSANWHSVMEQMQRLRPWIGHRGRHGNLVAPPPFA